MDVFQPSFKMPKFPNLISHYNLMLIATWRSTQDFWKLPRLQTQLQPGRGSRVSTRAARIVAALQPGCEEMEREWGNEEEMERKWGNGERLTLYISSFSLYFLPLSPFPPSLSISYIKMHHILLQNVKYGTFVANVTKISTYALWGNNSGSNLLRGSSAIRAGLLSPETSGKRKNHYNTNIKYLFCPQNRFKENVWQEIENLDKSDKRESHAESEHSPDVGDESNCWHHLEAKNDLGALL